METTQEVVPVARGYAYPFRLKVAGPEPIFPVGSTFRAELRPYPGAATAAGVLTTASGTLARIDDETLEVRLTAAMTAAFRNTVVYLDLVRTDPSPDVWVGVQLRLPVVVPITQPDAGA